MRRFQSWKRFVFVSADSFSDFGSDANILPSFVEEVKVGIDVPVLLSAVSAVSAPAVRSSSGLGEVGIESSVVRNAKIGVSSYGIDVSASVVSSGI